MWFNRHFAIVPALARVTSPCLVNPAAMQVFQHSSDHVLARLATADARTALPSACAYAAYRAPNVINSLGQFVKSDLAELVAPVFDHDLNVAGSELDVRLSLLHKAIEGLTERVARASGTSSWIEHHNQLTALTVLSLLASTGARPVNSPFESFGWFDFVRRLIFVDDKNSGPTQGSRLCILTDCARALLQDQYLAHLRNMADVIRPSDPAFVIWHE